MGNVVGNVSTRWAKKRCFELIADGDVVKLDRMLRKRPQFCDARNGYNDDGMSLLILASFLDQPEKVELLLKKGANPEKPCGFGVTALHMACLHGHTVVIRSLLKKGARPETADFFGQNALHYAAACPKLNREVVVQLLVNTKMDLNLRDHHMRTALHMACLVHHLNSAELLLQSGANLHLKDLIGRDALSYIINDIIREELAESATYKDAARLYEMKPFLIVLHHRAFDYTTHHLELHNILKTNKIIDFRRVFNVEELRMHICSYL